MWQLFRGEAHFPPYTNESLAIRYPPCSCRHVSAALGNNTDRILIEYKYSFYNVAIIQGEVRFPPYTNESQSYLLPTYALAIHGISKIRSGVWEYAPF
jgi:hypothetical protein